ncbi:MAG: hypothetical protein DRJ29_09325 [Bacteroidetes bacterium]|nr:MAG: hypothetical protein DRJ29_09325 [Bacteroidota bacterium]RLE06377.1 MAG: hypothetical protein DRJ13_00330 [Bacteroidota bacterium]
MKFLKHLKDNWFRYGFESLAIVVGILAAFALESWNDQRKTRIAADVYAQKIISDIVADTIKINRLIDNCMIIQESIDAYFQLFDQGNTPLSDLIDSAENISISLFRYLPINHTFLDMQSSGNTVLLNDEQRISLMELSNNQEFLQIIIDKVIDEIKKEEFERNKYLDFDQSPGDFFETISVQQDISSKAQGLKHQHNLLTKNHELAYQMISKGASIKEKSKRCLELLSDP